LNRLAPDTQETLPSEPDSFHFQIDPSSPSDVQVEGDEVRLFQVMANLLSNAAKFSPRDCAVTIRIEQEQEFVRVNVTDQGPGIPEAFRSSIFGRFAQADAAKGTKGTFGLGLKIARSIIELHQGKIGYETVGVGTTFHFLIPVLQEV
jgi:signal transduction histidine kinase